MSKTDDFRTYWALLHSLRQYAKHRMTHYMPRSVGYGAALALWDWANAYEFAGPRPIDGPYPPITDENAAEVKARMDAFRVAMTEWDARIEVVVKQEGFGMNAQHDSEIARAAHAAVVEATVVKAELEQVAAYLRDALDRAKAAGAKVDSPLTRACVELGFLQGAIDNAIQIINAAGDLL